MKKIIFLLCLVSLIKSTGAQTVDQQNTGGSSSYQLLVPGANQAVQVFKAGVDGKLHSVNIDISATACPQLTDLNIQVRILDSSGTSVLGLETVNMLLPISRNLEQIGFISPLYLEANHTYQIEVSLPSGQICDTPAVDANLFWYNGNDDTTYAEGSGYLNFSPIGFDYYFITNVFECTTPINAYISAIGFETCQSGDGAIICNATGGGGSLSYLWNTAATTVDLYDLSSNTYSVSVTDGGNCLATDSYFLPNAGTAVTTSDTTVKTLCYGSCDGFASITVQSGVAPYEYSWSNSDTVASISNLCAGMYIYTVTDINLCSVTDTVYVLQPNELTGSFIVTNESCQFGDGFLDLTPIGDFPPFVYSWGHGPTTQDVASLSAGVYSVTILDATGCTGFLNETVLYEPGAMIDTNLLDIQNNLCFQSNGHIANLNGAVTTSNPPIMYQLNGQVITSSGEFNLLSGLYTLLATDALGCKDSVDVTISDVGSPITVNQGSTFTPSCPDQCTGTIMVIAGGGNGTYSYSWSNGYTVANGMDLCAGEYTVVVTDTDGCSGSAVMTINPAAPIVTSFNVTEATCGTNDGGATVNVDSGGQAPFVYQWSDGSSNVAMDSVAAGNYSVNITDINGCEAFRVVAINSLSGPSVTENISHIDCNGGADGSIDLTITGGTAPISILWSTGHTDEDISSLTPGYYDVSISDASGCVINNTYEVLGSPEITITSTATPASCGGNDGTISITSSGGSFPHIYQWDANAGNATTQVVNNLAAGIYEVTVTDAAGCFQTFQVALSNDNAPSVNVDQILHPNCLTGGGAIFITASGGTTPYSYSWTNGSTAADLEDVAEGNYSLTITDASNCIASASFSLPGINIFAQEICMITVDSLTNMNKILWEKTPGIGIEEFRVYRETSVAGAYLLIAVVPYDSLSIFQDTVASSDIHAWKYKLATVDACGNESSFIASHKSIHLVTEADSNGDVMLIWDDYIGFPYSEFYISRFHTSTGWEYIDTVASSVHTYFDVNAPSGNLLYSVEVPAPSDCEPTRVGVNTSRSNVKNTPNAMASSVDENENQISLSIYPNPGIDEVFISLRNYSGEDYDLKLFNSIGEMILIRNVNSSNQVIDTREFPSGVYTVSLSDENQSGFRKLMIVK